MTSRHRRLAVPALAVVFAGVVAACSPDRGDFSNSAEKFIEKDDGDMSKSRGVDFDDAQCDEPATSDKGETFECVATGDDGAQWEFTVEITGGRDYVVTPPSRATDDAPSASTPGTTPDSTP